MRALPAWKSPCAACRTAPKRTRRGCRCALPAELTHVLAEPILSGPFMNQHTRIEAPIPFIDVAAQRRRLGARIDEAVTRVLDHCQFILGPETVALEKDLAAFCGARHALGVSNGTDALVLVMMAKGIGAGDAVFVPSFTYTASAEAIVQVGATPVFVDVDAATFNMDVKSLARAIA